MGLADLTMRHWRRRKSVFVKAVQKETKPCQTWNGKHWIKGGPETNLLVTWLGEKLKQLPQNRISWHHQNSVERYPVWESGQSVLLTGWNNGFSGGYQHHLHILLLCRCHDFQMRNFLSHFEPKFQCLRPAKPDSPILATKWDSLWGWGIVSKKV